MALRPVHLVIMQYICSDDLLPVCVWVDHGLCWECPWLAGRVLSFSSSAHRTGGRFPSGHICWSIVCQSHYQRRIAGLNFRTALSSLPLCTAIQTNQS